jgi:hypothetical protein
MADYRQAGAGGIIFVGLLQLQGQEMTYEETRKVCRRVFSAEIAKIEMDDRAKKDHQIKEAISAAWILLEQATADYKPQFESHSTVSDLENQYAELLAQIVDNLWIIAVRGKLIESVTVTQDEV